MLNKKYGYRFFQERYPISPNSLTRILCDADLAFTSPLARALRQSLTLEQMERLAR